MKGLMVLMLALWALSARAEQPLAEQPLAEKVESLKEQVVQLNRDLFILEEDLLFPASTQVALFVVLSFLSVLVYQKFFRKRARQSDQPLRTRVRTDEGTFDFQDYFVRQQCRPVTRAVEFVFAPDTRPCAALEEALADEALGAILICPSNPYLSIAPILAVPGLRALLRARGVPIVAVSPLVGGAAVKGPTAKIMTELGVPVSADEIVRHYGDLLDGFVLDARDAHLRERTHGGQPVRRHSGFAREIGKGLCRSDPVRLLRLSVPARAHLFPALGPGVERFGHQLFEGIGLAVIEAAEAVQPLRRRRKNRRAHLRRQLRHRTPAGAPAA